MAQTTPAQIKAAMKKLAAMKSVQQYIKLNRALQKMSVAPAAKKPSVDKKVSFDGTENLNPFLGILAGCLLAGVGQMASPKLAKEASKSLSALKTYLKTFKNPDVTSNLKFLITTEYGKDLAARKYASSQLKKYGVTVPDIRYLEGDKGVLDSKRVLVILKSYKANKEIVSFWKEAVILVNKLDVEERG